MFEIVKKNVTLFIFYKAKCSESTVSFIDIILLSFSKG